jgi:hypothetical protein
MIISIKILKGVIENVKNVNNVVNLVNEVKEEFDGWYGKDEHRTM